VQLAAWLFLPQPDGPATVPRSTAGVVAAPSAPATQLCSVPSPFTKQSDRARRVSLSTMTRKTPRRRDDITYKKIQALGPLCRWLPPLFPVLFLGGSSQPAQVVPCLHAYGSCRFTAVSMIAESSFRREREKRTGRLETKPSASVPV
jgi:hypothetical protein